jgi:hypothetical protein
MHMQRMPKLQRVLIFIMAIWLCFVIIRAGERAKQISVVGGY